MAQTISRIVFIIMSWRFFDYMDSFFDTEHLQRTYFKMAFPVMLGLVVTLIYNLADTYFIARTNNTNLIAGVSLCAPVFTILMAFGNIYGQGGSSLLSRMIGKNDIESVSRVSSFCFYISLITGFILTILMLFFRQSLLSLLGANFDTLPYAINYYTVLVIAAPIIVLSFIHSNLVRCIGMASESMFGTVLGALVNIVLDPVLISAFNMGATGAAIATVIGYLVSVIYFLVLLQKKNHCLSIKPSDFHVVRTELQQILGVGITAALSNLMQSLCVIVINQFLLSYGNDKIAAMGIVLKINMIAQLILTGFAFGGVPLFGYLYGADKHKELKKLVYFCMSFLSLLSIALTIILYFFASSLMSIFLKDSLLIHIGSEMLQWQVITTIFVGLILLITVLFQATGKIIPAFILSISRQGIIFIIILFISAKFYAYKGIVKAQALADIFSAAVAFILLLQYNPVSVKHKHQK